VSDFQPGWRLSTRLERSLSDRPEPDIRNHLDELDPDSMTPREALIVLCKLKDL
jgi:hypothetical protein